MGGSATGGNEQAVAAKELSMRTSSLWSSNLLILVYTSCILARFRTTNLFYFLRLQPLQYGMRSSDPGSAEPPETPLDQPLLRVVVNGYCTPISSQYSGKVSTLATAMHEIT